MPVTRRQFVRSASVATTAFVAQAAAAAKNAAAGKQASAGKQAGAADQTDADAIADATPKDTVNFALVGLGSLSTNQIAPAFERTSRARLKGIVTGTPTKIGKWQNDYGIENQNVYNYETFDKIKANDDIDVIYIVLPNSMHKEYVIRAAEAGKHVLCEKPMANSSADCRAMIDACKSNGVKLAIGYRCQFEPHHLKCLEFAQQKAFGEIKAIEGGFGFKIGDPNQWRLKKDLAGGGALMDVGIYALQACRFLTGEEPQTIIAQETKTDPVKFAEVDETITWSMTMPSGIACSLSTSYAFNGVNNFRAFAEKGSFGLEPAYSYKGIRGESSRGPIKVDSVDQFATEMDDFANCILENRESKVSGEEGLKDLLAVEAIYQSIRENRAIDVAAV